MTERSEIPPLIDVQDLVADEFTDHPSDLSPVFPAPPAAAVAAIHQACLDTGFFVITGHGLDSEMARLFDQARDFFDQPQAAKEEIPRINRYGFIPHRRWAIDPVRQGSNTEYLDLGLGDEVPLPRLDGFKAAVRTYQRRALTVGARILVAIAAGLGAEPDFFATRMTNPQCRLRLLHYPAAEPGLDGTLPVPTESHTDYGALTLLATDGVAGLEVKPIGGEWTPVVAPAGSLVVNLGDMLARWSNDVYRSTPHRVVGPVGADRISIPFFVNPDPATVVDCIPACVTAERPCRYGPVTAGEFLASRIDSPAEPYIDRHDGPVRRLGPAQEVGGR
ncbi:MAG: hypothetical protein OER95_01420 [Acidimicrobiia bacterium]|nr:hypothetical protein [Acidimicrobiia bacterium]